MINSNRKDYVMPIKLTKAQNTLMALFKDEKHIYNTNLSVCMDTDNEARVACNLERKGLVTAEDSGWCVTLTPEGISYMETKYNLSVKPLDDDDNNNLLSMCQDPQWAKERIETLENQNTKLKEQLKKFNLVAKK